MKTFDEIHDAIVKMGGLVVKIDSLIIDDEVFDSNLDKDRCLKSWAYKIDDIFFKEEPLIYKKQKGVMSVINTLGKYLFSTSSLVLSEEESPFVLMKLELKDVDHHLAGYYLRGFEGKYNSSTGIVEVFLQRINDVTENVFDLPNFSRYVSMDPFTREIKQMDFNLKDEYIGKAEGNKEIIISVLGEGVYRFKDGRLIADKNRLLNGEGFPTISSSEIAMEKSEELLNKLKNYTFFKQYSLESIISL